MEQFHPGSLDRELARVLSFLGVLLSSTAHDTESLEMKQESVSRYRRLVRDKPAEYGVEFRDALLDLANTLYALRRFADAERHFVELTEASTLS